MIPSVVGGKEADLRVGRQPLPQLEEWLPTTDAQRLRLPRDRYDGSLTRSHHYGLTNKFRAPFALKLTKGRIDINKKIQL